MIFFLKQTFIIGFETFLKAQMLENIEWKHHILLIFLSKDKKSKIKIFLKLKISNKFIKI